MGRPPLSRVIQAATALLASAVAPVLLAGPAGAPTTTSITSTLNPSFTSQLTTFVATVVASAAPPTGTVNFIDGAVSIPGCAAVPLSGTGNQRTASCPSAALPPAEHTITASYSGDAANAASSGNMIQDVLFNSPGVATIVSNTFGNVTVQGASLIGNTITSYFGSSVIQLGPIPGPGTFELDFAKLNLGPGTQLTIRAGAPDQSVILHNSDTKTAIIAGSLVAQTFSVGPPIMNIDSATGINLYPGGAIIGDNLTVNTLGASWTAGQPLINNGVVDGGSKLEMLASRITGGGEFRGDDIRIHSYGNLNNPVNGPHFLQNGLTLLSGHGAGPPASFNLLLNLYGASPQIVNLRLLGHVMVWMPSAWPAPYAWPANNAVVPPGMVRPAGIPEPAYGGGSMILQATGLISLYDGGPAGTGNFVFPGGIALKSDFGIDLSGVTLNQGWTVNGLAFQGIFLEAPTITSSTDIKIYSNDLNWSNFSVLPDAPVHAWRLTRDAGGNSTYLFADLTAPHLNTYSVLVEAAANGQCWICLVNPQPVDMSGR